MGKSVGAPSLRATLAAAGLLAFAAVGCRGPVVMDTAVVSVANQSPRDDSFHWQSPGWFGAAGTERILACRIYRRGFEAGDHRITITTSSDSDSFVVSAPSEGQENVWIVIAADGHIAEATEAEAEVRPLCPS